jgi:hypothetical protein
MARAALQQHGVEMMEQPLDPVAGALLLAG